MFILPTLYSRSNVSVVQTQPKAVRCAKDQNFVCTVLLQLLVQYSLTDSLFLQVVMRFTVFNNYCIYVFQANLCVAFSHTCKRLFSIIDSTVSEKPRSITTKQAWRARGKDQHNVLFTLNSATLKGVSQEEKTSA